MAKQQFPFFDPKAFGDLKLPNVDLEGLMTSHKKNLEAVAAAQAAAFEGFKTLATRQGEIFQNALTDARNILTAAFDESAIEDKVAKQADLAKAAYEKAIHNLNDLTEVVQKASGEATAKISARVAEAIGEFKHTVKPTTTTPTGKKAA